MPSVFATKNPPQELILKMKKEGVMIKLRKDEHKRTISQAEIEMKRQGLLQQQAEQILRDHEAGVKERKKVRSGY
jgi:hypothetical protein